MDGATGSATRSSSTQSAGSSESDNSSSISETLRARASNCSFVKEPVNAKTLGNFKLENTKELIVVTFGLFMHNVIPKKRDMS